ncbi:hypothetical protein CC1G_07834 [Coprinopsis cinerea okayama7|uniref:Uncharacterized protein n=1 Tax=Coprinopsis cinerea (strain Okayama-7 / 130 / ATCC MYA-4618 / FGSC 9003) TaxID=240176 RepID=A8P3Z7_COPC7|nr:hypothetical protein CC1G_07834 [Coprinopsis cinerea okayama7\|eukprot:XP_001838643.2 hypothetical protein CC1G_07834 [Coprinopsis cinerea okayama7\
MSHCIQLGEKHELARPAHSALWAKVVGLKRCATFTFKYRNIDFLVAQGIPPRAALPGSDAPPRSNPSRISTGSTSHMSVDAGPSSLGKRARKDPVVKSDPDNDERSQLDEEARNLRARLAEIEAKKASLESPSAKRVKREVKREPSGSAFVSGEVVDLTSESEVKPETRLCFAPGEVIDLTL